MSVDVSPDLLAFLEQEEKRARNEDLLDRAENAMKAYQGDYYGDEVDGQSKVVSRDVAEVVDHMNVSVLRTFVSGDRVVEFEPDSQEMEQVADDATEDMHRDFSTHGYSLLHDWLKEGNINTLGVVKACVEKRKQRKEFITEDPEEEGVLEAEVIPEVQQQLGMDLYRAVRLEEMPAEFRDYLVPLEEFRIAPDARRDPDEAVYIGHARPTLTSELVEMGLCTADEAESLSDGNQPLETLSYARDAGAEQLLHRQGANRRVMLLEEYVLYDADRDGIAERLCIHRVGNTVLRIEPVDYQPFVIYCPFPMPGRIAGHSLADKVTDIQRVNTALMRLYLDGQYLTLVPRMYVPQECVTENTYDDLLTVIAGGIVRGKGENGPRPLTVPHDGASALQALEFMIGQRESRTGITRLNQGLDADALNKTATGTALLQAQGQQIEEYLARNFAEAVARLMRLKLKLKSRYGSPRRLRVDGEYREIDPRQWPEDMEVMIRVGLGSGKKEQRVNNRMMLLQVMQAGMEAQLPIFQPEHVYKAVSGLVKDMNLGSPADFVADPSTLPPQEPQPDPKMAEVQAKMELEHAKAQMKFQSDAAEMQRKLDETLQKIQLEEAKAAAKAQTEQARAEFEANLAEREFQFNAQMALLQHKLDEERAARDADRADRTAEAKVAQNRAGGDLSK